MLHTANATVYQPCYTITIKMSFDIYLQLYYASTLSYRYLQSNHWLESILTSVTNAFVVETSI